MIAGARRFGDRGLTVGMERLLASDRRDNDRGRIFRAQQVNAHINLAHVDEATRSKLKLEKIRAIGAQRHLVVDTGGHVTEMRRRDVDARDRFEVEHVDRFLWALDQRLGA
jgi:hypothetical protein